MLSCDYWWIISQYVTSKCWILEKVFEYSFFQINECCFRYVHHWENDRNAAREFLHLYCCTSLRIRAHIFYTGFNQILKKKNHGKGLINRNACAKVSLTLNSVQKTNTFNMGDDETYYTFDLIDNVSVM